MSAELFLHGGNPYSNGSPYPFIYPVSACVIFTPFTLVPYGLAVGVWYALNLTLFFLIIQLVAAPIFTFDPSARLVLAGVVMIILLPILQSNLLNGQVNIIVLTLAYVGFSNLCKGKKHTGALCMAVAVSVKVTPVLLFGYLLSKGDVRAIVYMLISILIVCLLIPWLVRPDIFVLYGEYLSSYIQPHLSDSVVTPRELGFSILSLIEYVLPRTNTVYPFLISLVISGIPLGLIRLKHPLHTTLHQACYFCLFLLTILLISPKSQVHHLIFILPSLVILLYEWYMEKERILLVLLIIISGSLLAGKQAFYVYFFAIAACYAGMLYLIRPKCIKKLPMADSLIDSKN